MNNGNGKKAKDSSRCRNRETKATDRNQQRKQHKDSKGKTAIGTRKQQRAHRHKSNTNKKANERTQWKGNNGKKATGETANQTKPMNTNT